MSELIHFLPQLLHLDLGAGQQLGVALQLQKSAPWCYLQDDTYAAMQLHCYIATLKPASQRASEPASQGEGAGIVDVLGLQDIMCQEMTASAKQ